MFLMSNSVINSKLLLFIQFILLIYKKTIEIYIFDKQYENILLFYSSRILVFFLNTVTYIINVIDEIKLMLLFIAYHLYTFTSFASTNNHIILIGNKINILKLYLLVHVKFKIAELP